MSIFSNKAMFVPGKVHHTPTFRVFLKNGPPETILSATLNTWIALLQEMCSQAFPPLGQGGRCLSSICCQPDLLTNNKHWFLHHKRSPWFSLGAPLIDICNVFLHVNVSKYSWLRKNMRSRSWGRKMFAYTAMLWWSTGFATISSGAQAIFVWTVPVTVWLFSCTDSNLNLGMDEYAVVCVYNNAINHPWLGMVNIPTIYGDDWGMAFGIFIQHITNGMKGRNEN